MLGLVAAVTRSKWSWTHTYLIGPETIGPREAVRHFHDSVLTFTPRSWISSYFEALHSTERWSNDRTGPINRSSIVGRRPVPVKNRTPSK
jgi:hypothetical protein